VQRCEDVKEERDRRVSERGRGYGKTRLPERQVYSRGEILKMHMEGGGDLRGRSEMVRPRKHLSEITYGLETSSNCLLTWGGRKWTKGSRPHENARGT